MENQSKNGDVNFQSMFSKFTLDLLGNSIFYHDFGRLDEKSSDAYNAYSFLMTRTPTRVLLSIFPWLERFPLPGIKKLNHCVDTLKTLFLQIVQERKNGQKHQDILENLLSSQSEEVLSQVELLSNIWVFFLAGHETTATALLCACVCLVKHQDIQEKLFQEIEKTVGPEAPPTLDDLSKLHYLDCFINEVLRLYPPAGLIPTRIAVQDVNYKDQLIPKDSMVGVFIGGIHKNPNFWTNPEKFDPDRFSQENKKGRNPFAYLPFSLGPRQCIGNTFSLIEQRLFLTRLLQKFRVLPPKNPFHSDPVPFDFKPVYVHLQPR